MDEQAQRSEYGHLEGHSFDLYVVKTPYSQGTVEVPDEQEIDEVFEDFLFNGHDEEVETFTDCLFFLMDHAEYWRIRPGLWKLRLTVTWDPVLEDEDGVILDGAWILKITNRKKV